MERLKIILLRSFKVFREAGKKGNKSVQKSKKEHKKSLQRESALALSISSLFTFILTFNFIALALNTAMSPCNPFALLL